MDNKSFLFVKNPVEARKVATDEERGCYMISTNEVVLLLQSLTFRVASRHDYSRNSHIK